MNQVPWVYRVAGAVEVDASQGCIRREGEPDHYPRPKTLRVLLYLLEHRDRNVTKDELRANVWEHVAVTDDVLTGCVGEIRRAFGDGPRGQQFVRTLSKVGYRFVAPVEAVELAELPNAVPLPVKRPHARYRMAMLGAGLLVTVAGVVFLRQVLSGSAAPRPHREEVAWWKLDEGTGETVSDSSGNNNSGITRSPVWTAGKVGRALQFDGASASVTSSARLRGFPSGAAPRTVTAWIKTATTNGDGTCIFSYGATVSTPKMNSCLSMQRDGRISFGATYVPPIAGARRLDDDTWHHLAVTYEGSPSNIGRVFVDGTEDGVGKYDAAPETQLVRWRIGEAVTDGGTRFRGAIDDVRVYDWPLKPADVQALYRCTNAIAGAQYYMPIFSADAEVTADEIRNTGRDYAGVQFAKASAGCGIAALRGDDIGQDLKIEVELLVPSDAAGHIGEAGPYFRSRAAAPGDGIVGGSSAGYFVQLDSTGAVIVKRLNPRYVVAFTNAAANFDNTVFHDLELTARGSTLQVSLDGKLLAFDQAGKQVETVSIPPAWLGPPPVGTNAGTAGVGFSAENNRGMIGGQRARRVTFTRLGSP